MLSESDFRRAVAQVLRNLKFEDATLSNKVKQTATHLEELGYNGPHPALVAVYDYYNHWRDYEEKGENVPLSECGGLHDLYIEVLCECGVNEEEIAQLVESCMARTHEILNKSQ